jgi:predicted glycoside hydrolase/deacetylase ChbG (UPF0249 family)
MKHLIFTADDYGPVEFINKGIETALQKGVINTISVLMNPHGKGNKQIEIQTRIEQIRQLKLLFPNVNIGIHLSITSGKAITETAVNSLLKTNSEEFMDIQNFDYDKICLNELKTELENQIKAFPQELKIDHLSTHNGILTIFKDFFQIYTGIAKEFNIPVRQPYPISKEHLKGFKFSRMKRQGIFTAIKLAQNIQFYELIGSIKHFQRMKRLISICLSADVKFPDYFIDTYFRKGTTKRLGKILKYLPENKLSELVLHLGLGKIPDSDEIPNGINYKIFKARIKECNTLLNFPFKTEFEKHQIQMASFTDII